MKLFVLKALNGIESKKINLVRGLDGFRFTLSDLPGGRGPLAGQRVRSILDRSRCGDLKEGDVIEKINDITVSRMTHLQVVEILKACPVGKETEFVVLRGGWLLVHLIYLKVTVVVVVVVDVLTLELLIQLSLEQELLKLHHCSHASTVNRFQFQFHLEVLQ